jgi:hypothetical protein
MLFVPASLSPELRCQVRDALQGLVSWQSIEPSCPDDVRASARFVAFYMMAPGEVDDWVLNPWAKVSPIDDPSAASALERWWLGSLLVHLGTEDGAAQAQLQRCLQLVKLAAPQLAIASTDIVPLAARVHAQAYRLQISWSKARTQANDRRNQALRKIAQVRSLVFGGALLALTLRTRIEAVAWARARR